MLLPEYGVISGTGGKLLSFIIISEGAEENLDYSVDSSLKILMDFDISNANLAGGSLNEEYI